ncbi:hypothetical protein L1987_52657 [Smallanthus sonchifolius]|uniref:Uncharacterized protein n=1 Tax=Smallanthus sonchifolius TaxID=185202 RepID=A0ACB9ETQ5_9ASTR|nr:hypothetical protein L1987_52657 [Smallanthus sonchifolius]
MASDDDYKLTYKRTPNRKKDGISSVSSSSKKGKRKSYRLALRTSFSKFKNDQETPIILDEEETEEMQYPASKKLKLKLPKDVSKKTPKNAMQPEFEQKPMGVSKKTPKTSIQPEIVCGKKANIHPEDKDDDDFVTPPPPKAILKTPQPKRTHKEISRSKSGKEPEAQLENQYYEFTGKKIFCTRIF